MALVMLTHTNTHNLLYSDSMRDHVHIPCLVVLVAGSVVVA